MSASSSLLGHTPVHAPSLAPSLTADELEADELVHWPRSSNGQQSDVSLSRLQLAGVLSLAVLCGCGVALTVTVGLAVLARSDVGGQLFSSLSASTLSPLASPLSSSFSPPVRPMLSRGAFMFLCATQAEASHYLLALPPVIADVYIYCWKETCTLDALHSARTAANLSAYSATPLYVSPYTTTPDTPLTMRNGHRRHSPFRRHTDVLVVPEDEAVSGSKHGGVGGGGLSEYAVPSGYGVPGGVVDEFYRVVPAVSVWSEAEVLAAGAHSTWNSARNFLLSKAQQRETEQGWRYAYMTFGDGDVNLRCDRFQSVVRTGQPLQAINGTHVGDPGRLDSYLPQFLHWWHITRHTSPPDAYPLSDGQEVTCWLGYFASLLTAAPAQGTFRNVYSTEYGAPRVIDGEVAWGYDAILSSFHADAVPLLLPYCQRWDELTWWASQVVVTVRGVCTLGHALYFGHITVDAAHFTHQPYAKKADPWIEVDRAQAELHTVPSSLLGVQQLLGRNGSVGTVSLAEYGGWHSGLVSAECQARQADPVSCVWVSG